MVVRLSGHDQVCAEEGERRRWEALWRHRHSSQDACVVGEPGQDRGGGPTDRDGEAAEREERAAEERRKTEAERKARDEAHAREMASQRAAAAERRAADAALRRATAATMPCWRRWAGGRRQGTAAGAATRASSSMTAEEARAALGVDARAAEGDGARRQRTAVEAPSR